MNNATASSRLVSHIDWGILFVLAVGLAVRAGNISTWSLWEDEEGSMSLAQKPFEGFQGYFPIYFVALQQQMRLTGISIGAARALPAAMGLLSIALTYYGFRNLVGRMASLIAAMVIALNLGHVFFSQSVRYYTT